MNIVHTLFTLDAHTKCILRCTQRTRLLYYMGIAYAIKSSRWTWALSAASAAAGASTRKYYTLPPPSSPQPLPLPPPTSTSKLALTASSNGAHESEFSSETNALAAGFYVVFGLTVQHYYQGNWAMLLMPHSANIRLIAAKHTITHIQLCRAYWTPVGTFLAHWVRGILDGSPGFIDYCIHAQFMDLIMNNLPPFTLCCIAFLITRSKRGASAQSGCRRRRRRRRRILYCDRSDLICYAHKQTGDVCGGVCAFVHVCPATRKLGMQY